MAYPPYQQQQQQQPAQAYPQPGASQYPAYSYAPQQGGPVPAQYGGPYPPGTQQPAPAPLASSASYGQLPPAPGWPPQQQAPAQYAVDPRQVYAGQQQQQAPMQQQQQPYPPQGGPAVHHPHHQQATPHPAYAPQPLHTHHQPQYQQMPYPSAPPGWPQQPNGYSQPGSTMPPPMSGYAAPQQGSYYQPHPAPGTPGPSPHQQPSGRPLSAHGGPSMAIVNRQFASGAPQPHPAPAHAHAPAPPPHRYSISNPPTSSYAPPSHSSSLPGTPTSPSVSTGASGGAPAADAQSRAHSRAGSVPRFPTQKPSELSPLPSSASSSVSSRSSAANGGSSRHSPSLPSIPTGQAPPARANSLPQPPIAGARPTPPVPTSSYHGITPPSSADSSRPGTPVTAAAAGPSPRIASPQPSPLKRPLPLPSPLSGAIVPPRSSPSPLPSMRPASPLAAGPPLPNFPPTPAMAGTPTPPLANPATAANGRPLPRPPGGVLPSKSLDRGTLPAALGTAPGQWASLVGAQPAGGTGGIARAVTLPSSLPPLPRPVSLVGEGDQPTAAPLVPAPAPAVQVETPQTAAPPPPPVVVPQVVVPPTIVSDTADDLAAQLASTSISPHSAPTSTPAPAPAPPPRTPQKKAAATPAPFVIPTFSFADDADDTDAPASPAHSASSPGPKISFSSPKASPNGSSSSPSAADVPAPHQHAPPADQPALDAKSSTAARETSRLRNGAALAGGGVGVAGEITCASCSEQILGRLVSGAGGFWHPKCFKCTTCNLLLEHVSSYEHEGKLYCHLDYHELFTTRCYTCKTPIVDERFFTINDPSLGTPRYYHELHFFCSECGDPFLDPHRSSSAGTEKLAHGRQASSAAAASDDDVEAITANINLWRGHPYCDGCHVRLHAPKCKGCRKPIAGEMLEALGGKWHAECLKCESCEGPFEGLRIFEHEGMGLCEGCFGLLLKADL